MHELRDDVGMGRLWGLMARYAFHSHIYDFHR